MPVKEERRREDDDDDDDDNYNDDDAIFKGSINVPNMYSWLLLQKQHITV